MSTQAIALCCTAAALVFLVLGWLLGHKRGYDLGWVDGWMKHERLTKQERDMRGRFRKRNQETRAWAP